MPTVMDSVGLDMIFREARTRNGWQERKVDDQTLRSLYDLLKMGPTSANSSPARFVFVRSAEGKARLQTHGFIIKST